MINLEKINLKTDIAMSDKPDIQLIHNAILGGSKTYIIKITFFKDTPDEIVDIHEVGTIIENIMYRMSMVETEAIMVGDNKSAQDLYMSMKPTIRKYGKIVNAMGGVWAMYGVLNIIYSLNKNYYELVDECWKKIGFWE